MNPEPYEGFDYLRVDRRDGIAVVTMLDPVGPDFIARMHPMHTELRDIFPALAASKIGQVSVETINSRVPLSLLALLKDKDVQIGVIDVATDDVETPDQVCAAIEAAMKYVPKERIVCGTNCGMAPMHRDIAARKLEALGKGAALARQRFA